MQDKKQLEAALVKIQKSICAYGSATFCDCKYGAENAGKKTENGSGCPEIREIQAIFKVMTDFEYERMLKRIKKIQIQRNKAAKKKH